MTTPSTTIALIPAIRVLANTLTQTSESYQQLLTQPESYSFCLEAGRSVRYLSDRYTQVLLAAFDDLPVPDETYANWEEEDNTPSEEEPDE